MSRLSDKELRVLEQVSRKSTVSQRELANQTGVSLGLVNIILKKFLKTGYLQVTHLNQRKLEYILTPKGFLAVSRRTYKYLTRTIRDYHTINEKLSELLNELSGAGYTYFSIHGDGDLKEMLEGLIPNLARDENAQFGDEHREEQDAIVLNISTDPMEEDFRGNVVSVLDKIRPIEP